MAVAKPITLRYLVKINTVVIKVIPSAISTRPEAITTKSASIGSQVGTWAWKACRFDPKWERPAEVRKVPRVS